MKKQTHQAYFSEGNCFKEMTLLAWRSFYATMNERMANKNPYPELERASFFFEKIKEQYIREHHRKHLLISNETVVDLFDSVGEAYDAAVSKYGFEPGNFAIHQAVREDESQRPNISMSIKDSPSSPVLYSMHQSNAKTNGIEVFRTPENTPYTQDDRQKDALHFLQVKSQLEALFSEDTCFLIRFGKIEDAITDRVSLTSYANERYGIGNYFMADLHETRTTPRFTVTKSSQSIAT